MADKCLEFINQKQKNKDNKNHPEEIDVDFLKQCVQKSNSDWNQIECLAFVNAFGRVNYK